MSIGSVVKSATLDYLDYLEDEEGWTKQRKKDAKTRKWHFTASLPKELDNPMDIVLGVRNGINFCCLTGLPPAALLQPVFTTQGGHNEHQETDTDESDQGIEEHSGSADCFIADVTESVGIDIGTC